MSTDAGSWETNDEPEGATPLSPEEQKGLKPSWIATRGDLDLVEALNIEKALNQPRWKKMQTSELLDDLVLRKLHEDMFQDVWRWAGVYRTSDKNIGIDWWRIPVAVRDLVDDAAYWFKDTPPDDAAIKFHHDLVAIHPFPNGNGRHSRAIADLLLISLGEPVFTWGGGRGLTHASSTRKDYIASLQEADRGDLKPLLAFARS